MLCFHSLIIPATKKNPQFLDRFKADRTVGNDTEGEILELTNASLRLDGLGFLILVSYFLVGGESELKLFNLVQDGFNMLLYNL